ncbi:uncharacterized protein [Patagioenas fasciata]|uniref:uncharacterized protein n=1 Tax=Patagioenas fasciata TaxID=372321 RepID=UPI003A99068F
MLRQWRHAPRAAAPWGRPRCPSSPGCPPCPRTRGMAERGTVVSPAYPGSETRLLPPLSAFVSPPPSRCEGADGRGGEVVASRPTEPQRQLSTHPQRVGSGQGGGAGGMHRGPCSRPLQRRKTRLLTVAAARGVSPQPSRRVSPALRPRPACHPTPGPPRPPPRAARRSAGAPAAARRRLRAGSPPGRAIQPSAQVRSDLPSPLSRGRLPDLRDLHRQGRAAARAATAVSGIKESSDTQSTKERKKGSCTMPFYAISLFLFTFFP